MLLTIEYSDINNLNEIYNLLKLQQDDLLLKRILDKLNLILSISELTPDAKFKELITILGMMYLQDEEYQLTKKFSNRISRIFEIYYKENYEKYNDKLLNYYKIRSKIEHEGTSYRDFEKNDNKLLLDLLDITRKSILLYLKQPIIFTESNICNI